MIYRVSSNKPSSRLIRVAIFVLLLVSCLGTTFAQTSEDPLNFLERVTKHYREAESVHLEAFVSADSHNEFEEGTQRSVLSAYKAVGGRFRYEGHDSSGFGSIVSDGTIEWLYLHAFAQYAKAPAGTYFGGTIYLTGDNRAIADSSNLIQEITFLDVGIKAAHFLSPETIEVAGRKVDCAVVRFGSEDSTRNPVQDGTSWQTTIWIDLASLSLVKQQKVKHTKFLYGSLVPPFAQSTDYTTTTTYTATEINIAPKPETFLFQAPAGSTEVATLPSPYFGTQIRVIIYLTHIDAGWMMAYG